MGELIGDSSAADRPAVSGTSSAAGGVGAFGTCDTGHGVRGVSLTSKGVVGTSRDFHGVYGHSDKNAGVVGESSAWVGVYGKSTSADGGIAVMGDNAESQGTSGRGTGVLGTSTSGHGVRGTSVGSKGVVGTSQNYQGVYGHSDKNAGVVGESSAWVGVYGKSTSPDGGIAVMGDATATEGVTGTGTGVLGTSTAGVGMRAASVTGEAMHAESASPTVAAVAIHNTNPEGPGAARYAEKAGTTGHAGFFVGDVEIAGRLIVSVDVICPGADLAEQFDVVGEFPAEPGSVVVLAGNDQIRVSDEPYDRRVAGVVSGAGNYRPAFVLDGKDDPTRRPLALTGKVWCRVDADCGAISVGDLLTTSSVPGHAMRATDQARAFGAVIGKSLGELHSGRGLLPVLVSLQ